MPESEDTSRILGSPVEIMLWGLLGVVILALMGLSAWLHWRNDPKSTQPPLPIIAEVPEFSLSNRDGSIIGRDDLLGQPWVADFIFTRCVVVCPRMTHQMNRVVESLGDDAPVRFVSFSVDPEHDTPEVLQDYAQQYEAPERWYFLTGDRQELHTLSKEGFLLAIAEVPGGEQNPGTDPIVHSNRFVLVDAEGQIRSFYDAFDEAELERLLEDLEELTSTTP